MKIIKRLGMTFCMLFICTSQADIQGEMDGLFSDMMLNTTTPSVYDSQRRNGWDAGSVVVRNKIYDENIFAFAPPRIRGGCNGLDFYGGSFSFINSDALVQLVRGIAQNAVSYGFYIAMTAICETCADLMDTIQKKIQEMNGLLSNSCEVAKDLVDTSDIGGLIKRNDMTMKMNSAVSGVGDYFENIKLPDGMTSAEKANDNPDAQAHKEQITQGNFVWRAFKEKDMDSWFAYGDDNLLEFLMSLIGTIIAKEQDIDGSQEIVPTTLPHTIHFVDIMQASDGIPHYGCVDYTTDGKTFDAYHRDGCLSVTSENSSFEGFLVLTNQLIFGDDNPVNPPPGGLLGAVWASDPSMITGDTEALLRNVPTPVLTFLRNLYLKSPSSALAFAEQNSKAIAYYVATHIVEQSLQAISFASFEINNQDTKKQIDILVKSAKERLAQEANAYRVENNIISFTQIVKEYHTLMQAIPSRSPAISRAFQYQ